MQTSVSFDRGFLAGQRGGGFGATTLCITKRGGGLDTTTPMATAEGLMFWIRSTSNSQVTGPDAGSTADSLPDAAVEELLTTDPGRTCHEPAWMVIDHMHSDHALIPEGLPLVGRLADASLVTRPAVGTRDSAVASTG